jgi:hypothetical protein
MEKQLHPTLDEFTNKELISAVVRFIKGGTNFDESVRKLEDGTWLESFKLD